MKLPDIVNAPWAIEPERLREIVAIYAGHLQGEKADLAAIEARLGRPLANDQQDYSIREGGVAVLPVQGVIAPKANMFTRISGGASAQMLQAQLQSAVADPRVTSVILDIDSPGGSVFGSPELAASVFELAREKPIVAVSDAMMASAAYWIGSAANAVFISGLTVNVGSIGVVATHSYRAQMPGSQTTEITAGRYKRMGTSLEPLSDEARAYLQAQVDQIYSVFVDAVAKQRGVSIDQVLEHMADGRIFVGQQAIDAGLVDGVATLDTVAEQLASDPMRYSKRRKARIAATASADPVPVDDALVPPVESSASTAPTGETMSTTAAAAVAPTVATVLATTTREQLQAHAPALFAALQSEFTQAGAQGERDRITAVRSHSLAGHEALIEQLAFDGKTTGPEAAAAVLTAERTLRARAVQAHAEDAPKPVPTSASSDAAGGKSREQMAAEAQAYADKNGVDFITAYKQLGFS